MRPQLLISIFITVGLLAVGMAFAVSRSTPKRPAVTQSSGAITGRVLSPDGQPISAAGVHAEKSDFTFGRLLMFPTNDQGEFTITNLTPGTYKVSAAKGEEGFPPTDSAFYSAGFVEAPQVNVYEGQITRDVTVYLGAVSHSGVIQGRVVDTNGRPVSEAKIYVLKSDFTTGKIPTVYTNKEGRFSIKNLPAGAYTISVGKEEEGYVHVDSPFYSAGLVETPRVNVYEGQTTPDITVNLGAKSAKLTGHILDATTNKPINHLPNVQITLRREDNPELSLTTGLNPNGEFNILVPTVPVTVEVSAPGYEKRRLGSLHLRREEVRRLDVPLRRIR